MTKSYRSSKNGAGRATDQPRPEARPLPRIDPRRLAFDIDGVVADIMTTFLQLARERYGLTHLAYEDIVDFDLTACLRIDPKIVWELLHLLLYEPETLDIAPLPQAVPTLTRLGQIQPLLFVTARDQVAPIRAWLSQQLPAVAPENLRIIATGDPDAKAACLQEHGIRYFVEDRLETCFQLARHGIQPLVFNQPWNRRPHAFPIIYSWQDLAELIF